ncbi:MAG: penicillin-binding protein 2 [Akkermansiaceae bacterium]|nr:penicillin-binding protein 2 [Akkermansiaceae bacterium]MDP4647870.1 penicillin-binding protein 2 [Akkermansiaceae bacterium]MDP4722024.1 penicillin-binding protein 2 [Akkermansiaceae bacterium]MDP4780513.1 penicillin-binding protein 2 [Akkermansiaceae bacterium]MDP4846113.1 penicillin-binding protein 2 [Akkermansiaceae bacterium]
MNRAFQNRCIILCLVLVSLLSALSARLVQIQLVERQRYAASSAKAYHRTEIIPAIRGMIVDRNGEPIAKSIPVSSIFVDKNHLMDPKIASYGLAYLEASEAEDWARASVEDRVRRIHSQRGVILERETPDAIVQKHLAQAISLLARPLGMRRDELRAEIEDNKGKWFPVAKEIPDDIAERIRDIVDDNYLQGFEFKNSLKRWYTNPDIATHLTGFTGEISEKLADGTSVHRTAGRFGIESAIEEYLAGRDGRREHHRDSRGLVVPGKENSLLPPRAGLNAKLTIDIGIQSIVAEELERGLAEFKATTGSVIVMDPKTGEILAMASRPHFNLNDKKDLAKNSFNYAIQAKYEPGSTIKILAISGALDQGLVTLDTVINCPSFLQENKFTVTDEHSSGSLPVWKILQKSNNVGCWKLAKQLGVKRFYEYVHGFGFGEESGIQLSGENSGTAAVPKLPIDFSRASYGYYIGVTPIQMATAYSVIAGDGNLLRPHIVKSLIANDGTVVEDYTREIRNRVISEATAKKMRGALHKVTLLGGTATNACVPGHKVAGKTGTAIKHDPARGGYVHGAYVVSFAGFMPADDPAFVCYVVIDEPKTTEVPHYGGTIAAPIFARIATRLAAHMNIQPTEQIEDPIANR